MRNLRLQLLSILAGIATIVGLTFLLPVPERVTEVTMFRGQIAVITLFAFSYIGVAAAAALPFNFGGFTFLKAGYTFNKINYY